MSSWGVNLYQDDVTDGVRRCYQEKRRHGKSNAEAIEELYLEYEPIISDTDDGPLFWFALADTLWEFGCLTKEIQEKAIFNIPTDIQRWKQENGSLATKRILVLEKLKAKLTSPQPEEKIVKPYRLYSCPLQIGDVFAYPLSGEWKPDCWVLLQKCDEYIWHPGHKIPLMRGFLLHSKDVPVLQDLSCAEPIKTWFPDDNGQVMYVFQMITTSKRVIPSKKLIHLGNADLRIPLDDCQMEWKINYRSFFWKELDQKLWQAYTGHNLRKLRRYSE